MANPQNLVPFVKGDKRINRKGRPRSFDALRKLAQKIANEELQTNDGEVVTRIENLLRDMSRSKIPADRANFLAYAYGKPKEEVDVTSGGEVLKVLVEYANDKDTTSETPSSTGTDKAGA